MECESVRRALDERAVDAAVRAHVDDCPSCAVQRRVSLALRSACVVEAPPDLSARLLTLAQPVKEVSRLDAAMRNSLVISAPPELSRRLELLAAGAVPAVPARRPWLAPVYALTAVLLGVLLFVSGQAFALALQELGVVELWQAAAALPAQWLDRAYTYFPQGQYVVDVFFSLQRALQWVLVGLLMWAVLELRMPQRTRVTA